MKIHGGGGGPGKRRKMLERRRLRKGRSRRELTSSLEDFVRDLTATFMVLPKLGESLVTLELRMERKVKITESRGRSTKSWVRSTLRRELNMERKEQAPA